MQSPIFIAAIVFCVITVAGGLSAGQPTTMPAATTGAASCKLSPDEFAKRRQELIPGLFKRAERVEDVEDGLLFHFANVPGLLADLVRVMEREQDCCSFLQFELTAEAGAGPVHFKVTGPTGTGEMLRKL